MQDKYFPMILSRYLATLKNADLIEQAEFFQKKLSRANKVVPCRARLIDLKSFVSRLAVRLAKASGSKFVNQRTFSTQTLGRPVVKEKLSLKRLVLSLKIDIDISSLIRSTDI